MNDQVIPIQLHRASVEQLKEILALSRKSPYTKKLGEVRFIKDYFTREEMAVVVRADTHEILAFLLIHNLKIKPYTSIYYMGVHPDHKHRGLGKRLLNWAKKQSPWKMIRLGVDQTNLEGQQFWSDNGFVEISRSTTKGGDQIINMELTWE